MNYSSEKISSNQKSLDLLNGNDLSLKPNVDYYDPWFDPVLEGYGKSLIAIDSNNNFTATANINNWSGTGTFNDPIIINNMNINGSQVQHVFLIQNTNLYFILKNSTFYNTYNTISLSNVANGLIENNTLMSRNYIPFETTANQAIFSFYSTGITLENCSSIIITNNTILKSNKGIEIFESHNNNIINNFIDNFIGQEKFIRDSLDIYSSGIEIFESYVNVGLEVTASSNIFLFHNKIGNYSTGITFDEYNYFHDLSVYSNSTVENNIISNPNELFIGIYLNSKSTTVRNNILTNGGIYFPDANIASYPEPSFFENNSINGQSFFYSINSSNLSVPNDSAQVTLINCTNVEIAGVSFSNLKTFINIRYGSDINIHTNTFTNSISNSTFTGIRLYYSHYNTISYNNLQTTYGIELYASGDNVITNNHASILHLNEEVYDETAPQAKWIGKQNQVLNNELTHGIDFYHNLGWYPMYHPESGQVNDDTKIISSIFSNNTIQGKPLVVLVDKKDIVVPENAGQIIIINSKNITITNAEATGSNFGILILSSNDIFITNSTIAGNIISGIFTYDVQNIKITNNYISNNTNTNEDYSYSFGYLASVLLFHSYIIEISNNQIINNRIGIYIHDYTALKDPFQYNGFILNNLIESSLLSIWLSYVGNFIIINNMINVLSGSGISFHSTGGILFQNNTIDLSNRIDYPHRDNNFVTSLDEYGTEDEYEPNVYQGNIFLGNGTFAIKYSDIFRLNYYEYYSNQNSDANGDGIIDEPFYLELYFRYTEKYWNKENYDYYPLVNPGVLNNEKIFGLKISYPSGGNVIYSNNLTIYWTPAFDTKFSNVMSYSIFYSIDNGSSWIKIVDNLHLSNLETFNSYNWNFFGLSPSDNYKIKIIAKNNNGSTIEAKLERTFRIIPDSTQSIPNTSQSNSKSMDFFFSIQSFFGIMLISLVFKKTRIKKYKL